MANKNYLDFFENDRPMLHQANQSVYSIKKADRYIKKDSEGRTFVLGKGSRKRSKATCRMYEGSGRIKVNNRDFTEYFSQAKDRFMVVMPLALTKTACLFDINLRVYGGGINKQAEAAQGAVVKVDRSKAGPYQR